MDRDERAASGPQNPRNLIPNTAGPHIPQIYLNMILVMIQAYALSDGGLGNIPAVGSVEELMFLFLLTVWDWVKGRLSGAL